MKQRLFYLFLVFSLTQGMMAQITSLGLVEESNIANVDKGGYMRFIPELSFVDDYLYVATPKGLYRILYKSQTEWEKLSLTDELVLDIEVRGDTVIALTRNQLIYSLDGGKTAKSISTLEILGEDNKFTLEDMAVHPHNANQILVISGAGHLMRTHDCGSEWEEIDKETPCGLTHLFYNPSNADQLIGVSNNEILDFGSLLFSHDGGHKWMYGDGVYYDGNTSEICNVAFHPTIDGRVAVCGYGVYGLSDDAGASWTGVFEPKWGQTIVHITDILYDTRNPDILYGADWGGMQEGITSVVRSTDGGYTWESFYEASLAPNAYVLSFDMKDNLLALYTYGGGIYLLDVDALEASISSTQSDAIVTPYYDLMGRPVAHPTRGIYIKDGRKVVIVTTPAIDIF